MSIFFKNKNYSMQEINDICNKNNLATVDCLKDDNMISVEKWNDGEGEDCLFEFHKISNDFFKLTWLEKCKRRFSE
jgi:5'(3')-deoxyribonucleotidase